MITLRAARVRYYTEPPLRLPTNDCALGLLPRRLYAALGWGHWEAQEKDLQVRKGGGVRAGEVMCCLLEEEVRGRCQGRAGQNEERSRGVEEETAGGWGMATGHLPSKSAQASFTPNHHHHHHHHHPQAVRFPKDLPPM